MGFGVMMISSLLLFLVVGQANGASEVPFDQNYIVTWGNDHVSVLDQGREIQLTLDQSSGAGFTSKLSYESGFFGMKTKLPDKDSTCVVTTLYLNSTYGAHSELDFEFLGGRDPPYPYTLQTNVYASDNGNREQRIHLWFDPVKEFHDYQILWNHHQIVFFVDNIPIRVFKNNTKIGVNYPNTPMEVVGTIWEADWAAEQGRRVNWSQAPFKANYEGFEIQGCQSQQQCQDSCWWNGDKFWELSPDQIRAYHTVRAKYMFYDYCSDKGRYPIPPPECRSNQFE